MRRYLKGAHAGPLFLYLKFYYIKNVNFKIIYILLLSNFVFSETFLGYLRQTEVSFCMDECSQYYIENEIDPGFGVSNVIPVDESININLYLNRFVEIGVGNVVNCVECSAYEITSIEISDDCLYPVSCLVNPCDVDSCVPYPQSICEENYCGGCNADFYDSNQNLIDCSNFQIQECQDVQTVNFGMCDMFLGYAVVGDTCEGISGCGWEIDGVDYSDAFFINLEDCQVCLNECNNIEIDYHQLINNSNDQCEFDNDCISIWGDCDVGLGGCHYSVNYDYNIQNDLDEFVDLWLENDCMTGVCDCLDLPSSICVNNSCELAYCYEPNPVGCFQTGCADGYICVNDPDYCVSSSCFCDDSTFFGTWICTEDCGGGSCVVHILGDVNYDSLLNVSDIVIIVNMILGLIDVDLNADINQDNSLDIIDIVQIISIILQ